MTKNLFCSIAFLVVFGYAAVVQAEDQLTPVTQSPAEISIKRANEAIAKHPGQSAGYNSLAMALARRARETSDISYYQKAEQALQKSFAVSPDNFEGMKARAWLLLGHHE